jgi:hypothetical protein
VQGRLDTARVFERIFAIYGQHAAVLLGVALLVYLLAAAVTGVLVASGGVGLLFIAYAVTLVTTFFYDAMVVELVRDVQDGRLDQSVGGLLRSVAPVLPTLIGASLIGGIGIAIGFVALVIPGLVLLTWWALVAPVVIVERAGVLSSLRRSRELVRGHGWQVFGVLLVILFVNVLVGGIFGSIGDTAPVIASFSLAGRVLLAPLHAIAVATMFFEIKAIRGEAGARAAPEAPATV